VSGGSADSAAGSDAQPAEPTDALLNMSFIGVMISFDLNMSSSAMMIPFDLNTSFSAMMIPFDLNIFQCYDDSI